MDVNVKILLQSGNLLDVLQGVVDVLPISAEGLSALLQAEDASSLSPIARVGLKAYAKDFPCNLNNAIDVVRPDELRRSAFLARIEGYNNKFYLPLVDFPAEGAYNDDKAEALSIYEDAAIKMFGIPNNVASCVRYVMDEIADNITEHSDSKRGYVCISGKVEAGIIDICIADNGKTVLGSYNAAQGNEISSDLEAMQAANRGISTKNLPDAENRGYGITTSRNMLVKGLGGTFLMMSGDAVYINSPKIQRFVQMPQGLGVKGTLVAMRIPFRNDVFNYINFVE